MYNSLSRLPAIGYNILVYLAKQPSAENLWKMLKYSDYDCLSKPNLTFEEKMDLIWKQGLQEEYSVFLTPLVEDGITESKSIIKIYDYYIQPEKPFLSTVIMAFDFLYGGNMALIDFNGIPASRSDVFVNIILATLNGADVGGVGKMGFLDDMSRYIYGKVAIGNARTFTGIQLFLGVQTGDTGVEEPCGD